MKVCSKCGDDIDGSKDGDNLCLPCEDGVKKAKRKLVRQEREALMRSCGLVKVRGALGGTYWE